MKGEERGEVLPPNLIASWTRTLVFLFYQPMSFLLYHFDPDKGSGVEQGAGGARCWPLYPQFMKRKYLSILVSSDIGMTPSQSFPFTISKFFSKSCPRTTDQNPRRAFKKVQMTGLNPRDAEFVDLRWDRWACHFDKKPLTRFLMHTKFWVLLLLEGLLNLTYMTQRKLLFYGRNID